MKTYKELEPLIEKWAEDKGILSKATPIKQAMKTQEEVSELCNAILDDDSIEIKDAIGYIIVTLIIQAKMQGLTIEECLNAAYDVISKRTGKMINGQFVKDESEVPEGLLISAEKINMADAISHQGYIYIKYNDLI